MKKSLILAALVAASSVVSAQTTELVAEGCSDNRFCYDADGEGTMLYATASNGGIVELIFANGTIYMGKGPVDLSITNYAVYRQPANDAVIYVSAQWQTWTTKGSGSGRGGYVRHVHWALLGGELTQ